MIRFTKPEVGRRIRVMTRHTSYIDNSIDPRDYQDFVYEGTVLADIKWTKPGYFEMTGDPNDIKRIPFRRIKLDNMVFIEYIDCLDRNDGKVPLEEITEVSDGVWEVAGSKGNTHTVRRSNGEVTCTCPGFTYRRNCKHAKTKT